MPEEKDANVVSMEEHNKVIGVANTAKAENEKMKSENEELKKKLGEKEETEKKEEVKAEWKKELEERDKQIEELKKQVEEKKEKVSKGIVTEPQGGEDKVETEISKMKEVLDKHIPDRKVNPEKFGSRIQRYGFYKNGATKQYTHEQLGQALELHREFGQTRQNVSPDARRQTKDIIV